jgi:hypothetical protein
MYVYLFSRNISALGKQMLIKFYVKYPYLIYLPI